MEITVSESLSLIELADDEALRMGGHAKLERRRAAGLLNARERIDVLLDEGSFVEDGRHAVSARASDRGRTPADGKVAGFGRVAGRRVAVVSNDFTVMGASSSSVNARKIDHVKKTATRAGMPIVFLGESTGARIPDAMGARGLANGNNPTQYLRQRETPWAAAVLGHCYGSSAWYACLSDFTVMRKGAVMAVSSPLLTSFAIGEEVDGEELGGSELHYRVTGLVDRVVETDEEAVTLVKTFLSYLPSNAATAPPDSVAKEPEGEGDVAAAVPASPTAVYDMRRVIRRIVDADSLFELKEGFGRSIVTGLARVKGRVVGIVASNPRVKGGAIDVDACEKTTSFLVLCDSFNIPLVFLVDQPGFLIGVEGERRKAPGKVMNWMNALSLVTVPRLSIVVRKSFGQAILNMGGAGNSDVVAVWPSANVNFMAPKFAARIIDGPDPSESTISEMDAESGPMDMAAAYSAHDVILPNSTRGWIDSMLDIHHRDAAGGIGSHLMRTWPTTY